MIEDHDLGDEDRRPVVTSMLDLLVYVDNITIRRPTWQVVEAKGNLLDRLQLKLLDEAQTL